MDLHCDKFQPSTVSGSSVSLPAATLHKLYPSQEARQKVRAMVKPSIRPNLPKTSTTAADWSGSDDELTAAMEQFESTHPSGILQVLLSYVLFSLQ